MRCETQKLEAACTRIVVALLLVSMSAGCVVLSQNDAVQLKRRIYETHAYAKRTDDSIASVKDQLSATIEESAKTRANTDAVIDQLRTELKRTQSVIEENTFQLGELKRKLDELRANIYPKLGILEKGGTVRQVPPESGSTAVVSQPVKPALPPAAPMPVSPIPIAPATPAPAAPAATPALTPAVDPAEDYRRAYNDYNKGNYELAKMGFTQYLSMYPDTDDADNAQFWLAQCYFKNGENEAAIKEFQKLYKNFPRSDKIPNAMFTESQAELQLGHKSRAQSILKQIIDDYPASDPAGWARTKLNDMGTGATR